MESIKEFLEKNVKVLSLPEPGSDNCYKYILPKYSKPEGVDTKTLSVDYKKIVRVGEIVEVKWSVKRINNKYFGAYTAIYCRCGPGIFDLHWYLPWTIHMMSNYLVYRKIKLNVGETYTEEVSIVFKKPGVYAITFGALVDKSVCGEVDHMQVCSIVPCWDSYVYAVFIVLPG